MRIHARFHLLATAAAGLLPLSAHASPDPADNPDPLDEVVITATRLPVVAQDTPGARVIDRETIERRGAVFAADILPDVPGLSVYRAGFGGVTSVRMRGAAQDKSLVLVDGVPVNDPSQPAAHRVERSGLGLGAYAVQFAAGEGDDPADGVGTP